MLSTGSANATQAERTLRLISSLYSHAHHDSATATCPLKREECQRQRVHVFNMYGNTVAHLTLPFGTLLLLTNPINGLRTIGRVCDRGPFIAGRTLDSSLAIAEVLDFVAQGHTTILATILYQPRTASELTEGRSSCRDQSEPPKLISGRP